jgi:hypothetical protein
MSIPFYRKIVLKRKSWKVLFFLIISFLFGCSKIDKNIDTSHYDFAIYLLKDPNIKINDILSFELVNQDSQALAKIELQPIPWLADNDIQMYDFSDHLLYLERSKYDFLPKPVQLDVPSSWYDRPFMVVASGLRRYIGTFRGFFAEKPWPVPVIDCSYNFLYPEDLLVISWQWFNHNETDNRNDSYVKEALDRAGILHNGLNLKLKNIGIPENSDTATVEYTFTLINNDVDNLYVLDPDKMGSELFHYYIIGPQFVKSDELGVRTASLMKPIIPRPSDTLNPNWYIKLNSGDSITRTVNLRGYPIFPSGNYDCETTYQCIRIPKIQRTLHYGRFWIGPTKSNLIGIQF